MALGEGREILAGRSIFGSFLTGCALGLISPLERALVLARVSPILVTTLSLVACLIAGLTIALGHLAMGGCLYVLGGILDMLDGRVARAQNRQSRAGALFDSVADRWAELAVFSGFMWLLRDTSACLVVVMLAAGGSMMVSYTRARGESLGVKRHGGAMQRAERILLVAVGTLIAAWFGASADTAHLVVPTLGVSLGICGALSVWTALGRWMASYRELVREDALPAAAAAPTPVLLPLSPTAKSLPSRYQADNNDLLGRSFET